MFYTSVNRPWYVILKEKKNVNCKKKKTSDTYKEHIWKRKKKLKTTIKRYFVHLMKIFFFFLFQITQGLKVKKLSAKIQFERITKKILNTLPYNRL